MPCETAIITSVYTVKPDMQVNDALGYLKKHDVRTAPVVDDDGKLVGMLSLTILLKNLLPVSVTMEKGLQKLGFVVSAGAGIAKRLRKVKTHTVADVMLKELIVLHPSTPIWEAIRLIVKHGSPLPVVDKNDGNPNW